MTDVWRFRVTREPDDELASARVSLGSVPMGGGVGAYLVFRGEPDHVVELLEAALEVAKHQLPAGKYVDKRGRPQG